MCRPSQRDGTGAGRCSAPRREAAFLVAQGVDGRIVAGGEPLDRSPNDERGTKRGRDVGRAAPRPGVRAAPAAGVVDGDGEPLLRARVNHYYVRAVDEDFGPFFIKFRPCFPFNAKLRINGHE